MNVGKIETWTHTTSNGFAIINVVVKIGKRYFIDTHSCYTMYKNITSTINFRKRENYDSTVCGKKITHALYCEGQFLSQVVVLGTKKDYFNWILER